MPARSLLRLTLVRHAKTEPARSGQEDWDRVLEPRGQQRRAGNGASPEQRKLKPERIMSSPAVRAFTTATIMARELGVAAQKVQQDERLYLASPKAHARRSSASWASAAKHLMVVGHNPGLTEFADRISAER